MFMLKFLLKTLLEFLLKFLLEFLLKFLLEFLLIFGSSVLRERITVTNCSKVTLQLCVVAALRFYKYFVNISF